MRQLTLILILLQAGTGWTVQGDMKMKINSTCTKNCSSTNSSTPFSILGGYYPCAAVDTNENEWVLEVKSEYNISISSLAIYKYVQLYKMQ